MKAKILCITVATLILTPLFTLFTPTLSAKSDSETVPVYRYWNWNEEGHFFSTSEEETRKLDTDYFSCSYYYWSFDCNFSYWDYEGIAYRVPKENVIDSIPVYRFFSTKYGAHFYTLSETEKDNIISEYDTSTWNYEGIAYYAFLNKEPGTIPIYRFWSPKFQRHFFTASTSEKNEVIEKYNDYTWTYEGIAFYAYTHEKEQYSDFIDQYKSLFEQADIYIYQGYLDVALDYLLTPVPTETTANNALDTVKSSVSKTIELFKTAPYPNDESKEILDNTVQLLENFNIVVEQDLRPLVKPYVEAHKKEDWNSLHKIEDIASVAIDLLSRDFETLQESYRIFLKRSGLSSEEINNKIDEFSEFVIYLKYSTEVF